MDGVKSKNSRQRSGNIYKSALWCASIHSVKHNIFLIIFSVLLECLEHLATMIEDYGTSICQPSVAAACKEIAKSIGDRDNSVRTAALNCFVAAFFLHGEALFKFVGNVRIHFIVFNIMITDKWLLLNVYIENQINR